MQISREILDKFWMGKCSKDEVRIVLKWFNSIDAEVYFSENVDDIWQQYQQGKISKHLSEATYEKIQKRIENKIETFNQSEDKARGKNPYYILRIAAAIVLLISAIATVNLFIKKGDLVNDNSPQMVEWIEKSTRPGQKLTIFLKDGTKVILNAESSIRYASTYLDSSRYVFLQGEAYFDVVHDTLRPFTVYAGNISTTALGTSFNIRHYQNEKDIQVSLLTGKVRVGHEEKNEKILLEEGEGISFNQQSGFSNKYKFNPMAASGWKDGIIYFKDATNGEIIEKLERWYGVKITLERNLNNNLYTGEFENMSLEEVLQGLSYVKNFTFEINYGEVRIK